MKKYIILLAFFSLISVWPFFVPGFFKTHDGEWMLIRFTAFHQTLAAGQFPVRFVDRLNQNYGYPVINFLYPLPFYLSEIPKLAGFGPINSIKFTFVISTVMSTIFMFWALKQYFNNLASFTGALIYLYIPYRFTDLYVRGSIGENLSFMFIPLIFGAIIKISKSQKQYLPLLSFAVASLILAHNVIALLFIPFFSFVSLILAKKNLKYIIISFTLGLLISAFFWFPALYDLRYVKLSQLKVSEISSHLVSPAKLLIPTWGYGPNPNSSQGMSIQFGLVSIISFILFTYTFLRKKRIQVFPVFLIIIYISIFILQTRTSEIFWHIPGFDIIQFPWRMLSIIVFITAFFAAHIIHHSKIPPKISLLFILIAIVFTIGYTKPESFIKLPDSYYETNEDSTTVREEYIPLWVHEKKPQRADQKIEISQGSIIKQEISPASYRAKILAEENNQITINTVYFPGWEVRSQNKKISINYSNPFGFITFKLPKGEHDVIIKYNKTPVHLLSEILSIAALFITGFFFFKWRKQNF